MWRRILLAGTLTVFSIPTLKGDDGRSWAGLKFAKSLKTHHSITFDGPGPQTISFSRNVALVLLTDEENPLPDSDVIPPLKQHFEYVLPTSCVSAISAGKDFKCTGRDKDHLVCSGMVVTVRGKVDECLQINVVKEK